MASISLPQTTAFFNVQYWIAMLFSCAIMSCFFVSASNAYLVFMQTHYVLLLYSFKEQLQQLVRVHAMEAVMACWELEQTLQSLTGS